MPVLPPPVLPVDPIDGAGVVAWGPVNYDVDGVGMLQSADNARRVVFVKPCWLRPKVVKRRLARLSQVRKIARAIVQGDLDKQVSTILKYAVHWPRALSQAMEVVHRLRDANFRHHRTLYMRVKRRIQSGSLTSDEGEEIIRTSASERYDF